MSVTIKTHDLTLLEDLLKPGSMRNLATALDIIRKDLAPRVVLVLTRKDDLTGEEVPYHTFTNVKDFDSWRDDFERVPDTSALIQHLKNKYKDHKW